MIVTKRLWRSYHEAGHAVVARKLGADVPHVTARGDRPEAIISSFAAADSDAAAFEKDAIVQLAGLAADRHRVGITETACLDTLSDDDQDTISARSAIYRAVYLRAGRPFATDPGLVTVDEDARAAMETLFRQLQQKTAELVAANWRAIDRVAKALNRHDAIDQHELDRLIAVAEQMEAVATPRVGGA